MSVFHRLPVEIWSYITKYTGKYTINLLLCNKYFLLLIPVIKYQKNITKHLFKHNYLDVIKYIDFLRLKKNPLVKNYWIFNYCHDELFKMCCKLGNLDIIKYMVANKFNIRAKHNRYIGKAAKFGHINVVKYLVRNGCQIKNDYHYAVRISSKNGHLKILKYLVKNGGNIKAFDNHSIKLACENNHLSVVKYLIKKGADIYADSNNCITNVILKNCHDVFKYLVKIIDIHKTSDIWFDITGNMMDFNYDDEIIKNYISRVIKEKKPTYDDIYFIVKKELFDFIDIILKTGDQKQIKEIFNSAIFYKKPDVIKYVEKFINEKILLDIYYNACNGGRIKIVKYLSSKPFINETIEKKGYELAKKNWEFKVMRYFILKGLKVEIDIFYFLVEKIYNGGDLEFLKYLLSFEENKKLFIKNLISFIDFEWDYIHKKRYFRKHTLNHVNENYFDKCYKNHYEVIKFLIKEEKKFITYIDRYIYLIIFHDDIELYKQYYSRNLITLDTIIEIAVINKSMKILNFLTEKYVNHKITSNIFDKIIIYGNDSIFELLKVQNEFTSVNCEIILSAIKNKNYDNVKYIITIGMSIVEIESMCLFNIFEILIKKNKCDILKLLLINNYLPKSINCLVKLSKNKEIKDLLKSYIPTSHKICYN
ncbi:ankyrin repeat protein [Moumouvirus australiensis]|uniref:Ankyrin repeat protein n=1 Tax=Moumouvirus australiensis TaxID=2109587 RepID=A0A2P1EN03_9VIRU|nr:ankyrin repeat protein [Moumouvirus australiensis]AVL95252.1 ankyrin repeat protein [Moumouvirus australiensis]